MLTIEFWNQKTKQSLPEKEIYIKTLLIVKRKKKIGLIKFTRNLLSFVIQTFFQKLMEGDDAVIVNDVNVTKQTFSD